MNAYEIIENANYDLDHNKITLGEWEKRIEPTKDVKPIVRGEWIEHNHNGIAHIECSKCLTWFPRMYLTRNSYCPNCGADMRKEQQNED